jgi:hypothetical protein
MTTIRLTLALSLVLAGALLLASCSQPDKWVGTWTTDGSLGAVETLVITRSANGYTETLSVAGAARKLTFSARPLHKNLLMPLVGPMHGGFALWYLPATDRLGMVEGGGAPEVFFTMSD